MKYYSKLKPDVLLFSISRGRDITHDRLDLSPDSEYLQVAAKKLEKGKTFRPHKHKVFPRQIDKTHEAWVFLEGKVMASFYDLDDSLYLEVCLEKGDCAVAYNAGHSFVVLEEDTVLYEFKNGPYCGVEMDKQFLDAFGRGTH